MAVVKMSRVRALELEAAGRPCPSAIEVEPEWVIKQHPENHLFSGQWYAGPKRLFTGHETPTWKTESRAETFLQLLKEEWWDE